MDLLHLFSQLGVMMAVAVVCGQIARSFGQPMILGELLGGILLGPTVFGFLAPTWAEAIFPSAGLTAMGRDSVIALGMLFFLFVAGLEVDIDQLRKIGMKVFGTGLLGILVPFSIGAGSVLMWPGLWGSGGELHPYLMAMLVGTALSITALPVIVRILIELGLQDQEFGAVVMVSATLNDLIGWSLFAFILATLHPSEGNWLGPWSTVIYAPIFVVVVVVVGRRISRPALVWIRHNLPWPSGFIGVTTVIILLAAVVAERIGIEPIFGAFFVGIALGQTDGERHQAHDVMYQFAMSFFAPLYFVSLGLRANYLENLDLVLTALVIATACFGKIVGSGLGAWLSGFDLRQAAAFGFAMNARGAMEMILASVAYEAGLIDQRIFVALVTMAVVTSVLSGPAIKSLLRVSPRQNRDSESVQNVGI